MAAIETELKEFIKKTFGKTIFNDLYSVLGLY